MRLGPWEIVIVIVVILIIYFGVRSHIRRKMDMVHRARPGGVVPAESGPSCRRLCRGEYPRGNRAGGAARVEPARTWIVYSLFVRLHVKIELGQAQGWWQSSRASE